MNESVPIYNRMDLLSITPIHKIYVISLERERRGENREDSIHLQ
jgi:hypothetical protein